MFHIVTKRVTTPHIVSVTHIVNKSSSYLLAVVSLVKLNPLAPDHTSSRDSWSGLGGLTLANTSLWLNPASTLFKKNN